MNIQPFTPCMWPTVLRLNECVICLQFQTMAVENCALFYASHTDRTRLPMWHDSLTYALEIGVPDTNAKSLKMRMHEIHVWSKIRNCPKIRWMELCPYQYRIFIVIRMSHLLKAGHRRWESKITAQAVIKEKLTMKQIYSYVHVSAIRTFHWTFTRCISILTDSRMQL